MLGLKHKMIKIITYNDSIVPVNVVNNSID